MPVLTDAVPGHPWLQRGLLACGIAYGVAYVVANDVVAAVVYDGYSRLDQAISELSATAAPSRTFLTAVLPVFTLLVLCFGVGVWRAAGGSRALRVTGALLVAQGFMFPVWLLFPMTSRADMVAGTTAANDVGHLVLGAVAVLLIVAEMVAGALAIGTWFRWFSVATVLTTLGSGGLVAGTASTVAAGDATPWMGLVERFSYGSWLLWMAVLAIVLLRRTSSPERPRLDPDRTGRA